MSAEEKNLNHEDTENLEDQIEAPDEEPGEEVKGDDLGEDFFDDSDLDDHGELEDEPEEEPEDEPENQQPEKAEDKPESEKIEEAKADAENLEELPEDVTLEDEIKARILPDFVPGSKEFFSASVAEAKARVEKELGSAYDEIDPEHIARFQFFLNEEYSTRKTEYQKAIEIVKADREQRGVLKQRQAKHQQVVKEINAILPTPALQKAFDNLLEDMSKNSRGDYLVLMEQLANGDSTKFVELAKKITGPHKEILDKGKPGKPAGNASKPPKAKELTGSDILGF